MMTVGIIVVVVVSVVEVLWIKSVIAVIFITNVISIGVWISITVVISIGVWIAITVVLRCVNIMVIWFMVWVAVVSRRMNIMVSWLVVGLMSWSMMVGCCAKWKTVGHLLSKENLRKSKTNRVSKLVIVLILPLCHGIHKFVIDILAIDDQIVVDMEDKVPWICESLAHSPEFVKISSNGSLALFEFSSNITDDSSEVFNSMENTVESGMSEFVNNSSNSLPDMLCITEAFNTMWNFSLYSSSEQTFKNFTHSEEREVNV